MPTKHRELLNWLSVPQNEIAVAEILAGRAAVVPLGDVLHFYGQDGEDGWKDIREIRLDKPCN